MGDQTTIHELQQATLFKGIPARYIEELAELCEPVEFKANSTVFEEYAIAKDVYVIVRGQVSLAICEPDVSCRQISAIGDGDLMGWSPLVGRTRLSDTAYCVTPVRAYKFDGEQLLDYCRANPEFGYEFMHRAACTMADRLSGTRLQLMKMCGLNLPKVQVDTD
jgi:CRP-like cAMP-binding protein